MALTPEQKKSFAEHGRSKGDTGSGLKFWVALLTANINGLSDHFQGTRQGSPQPSRPAQDGEPAPQPARLSAQHRPRPLSGADRKLGLRAPLHEKPPALPRPVLAARRRALVPLHRL